MRDLLKDPMWTVEDLGRVIPDTLHGCSVCLPTTQSIIDYEDGKAEVVEKMEAGYPRFFIHPKVKELFAQVSKALCSEAEQVLIFSNEAALERAQLFYDARANTPSKIASHHDRKVLIVSNEEADIAFKYWRYTGEGISSREAEDLLTNPPQSAKTEKEQRLVAENDSLKVRTQFSTYYEADPSDLFLVESGMTAWFLAHRCITANRPGLKTFQLEFPYVDLMNIQRHFGSDFDFESDTSEASLANCLKQIQTGQYAAVYTEAPSNPLLRVLDIAAISKACRESQTPFIIDDTVASVLNIDLTEYADIIVTSMTKWASGQADLMAGMVTLNPKSPHHADFKQWFTSNTPGHSSLYARDAKVLAERVTGFETRMNSVNHNSQELVDYLSTHPAIESVFYPTQPGYAHRENYAKIQRSQANQIQSVIPGGSGLVSIVFKEEKAAQTFYDELAFSKGPSLGTEFSLACLYTQLAHYDELEWAASCGVDPYLVRLSIGIEPTEVLFKRVKTALAHLV